MRTFGVMCRCCSVEHLSCSETQHEPPGAFRSLASAVKVKNCCTAIDKKNVAMSKDRSVRSGAELTVVKWQPYFLQRALKVSLFFYL